MRDVTIGDLDRLEREAIDAAGDDVMLSMDEEAFRLFYERTARSVWLYLVKVTGSSQAADDLLQEAYYRFLKTKREFESDEHRRNYLYRIATNLVRDARKHARAADLSAMEESQERVSGDEQDRAIRRADLARAMDHLKPRDRALLWLAYAQGSSHDEIAGSLGIRKGSVKQLLFRARRRLAALLGRS
jgi:RNA polymerase sigma-70 factor (ECF subfamily)